MNNTSCLGLGWSLSTLFITTNHRGTTNYNDDVFMGNFGPLGGGQLFRKDASSYATVSNPYLEIKHELCTQPLYPGEICGWVARNKQGLKIHFGGIKKIRTVPSYGNKVGFNHFTTSLNLPFTYQWDADYLEDERSGERIYFEYQYIFGTISNPKFSSTYVRSGYLKRVFFVGSGTLTNPASEIAFIYSAKNSDENQVDILQRPAETLPIYEDQKLNEVQFKKESIIVRKVVPSYGFTGAVNGQNKRTLLNLTTSHLWNGIYKSDVPISFIYENSSVNFLLKNVTLPTKSTFNFSYSALNFSGTEGARDTREQAHWMPAYSTTVTDTDLLKWKVQAKCDERLCYLILKDGDDKSTDNLLQLDVRVNTGTFFGESEGNLIFHGSFGGPGMKLEDLDVIPNGDEFLVVDKKKGIIRMFTWNGDKFKEIFPFSGDSRYSSTNGLQYETRVYPSGGNYILVHRTSVWSGSGTSGKKSEIIPLIKSPDGTWKSLNRTSTACDVDLPNDNLGETYGDLTKCLDFPVDDILVSPSSNYFVLVEQSKDIILYYRMKADGTGFNYLSKQLPAVSGVSTTDLPMNWNVNILDIYPSGDYFVIRSKFSNNGLRVFSLVGDNVYDAGSSPAMSTGTRNIYPFRQHIIEQNDDNNFILWTRSIDGTTGKLKFNRSGTVIPLPNQPNSPGGLFARFIPGPNIFSIEYYKSADSVGTRPVLNHIKTDYAVYYFTVDSDAKLTDVSSKFKDNSTTIFSASYSPVNRFMSALTARYTSDQTKPCGENQNCSFVFKSYKYKHWDLLNPIDLSTASSINLSLQNSPLTPSLRNQTFMAFSGAGTLAMMAALDKSTRKVRFNLYMWGGKNYQDPEPVLTVSSVTENSGINTSNQHQFKTEFTYGSTASTGSSRYLEWDAFTQLPLSRRTEVKQRNSIGNTLGRNEFEFDWNSKINQYTNWFSALNGQLTTGQNYDASGKLVSQSTSNYEQFQRTTWPLNIFQSRLKSQVTEKYASNGSFISSQTDYCRPDTATGQPTFVLTNNKLAPYTLSQTVMGGPGKAYPMESYIFKLASLPTVASLNSASGDRYQQTDAVSASRVIYDSRGRVIESQIWRDNDAALTLTDLKIGTQPSFRLDRNWFTGSKSTRWDTYNGSQLPQEICAYKNTETNGSQLNCTSIYYEGINPSPVATVSNSEFFNSAVLMAENGETGTSVTYDRTGRWTFPGTTFSSDRAHSGRFSYKVVNNFGPSIDIPLSNAKALKYGYRVSAWIYSTYDISPVLGVQQRYGSGTTGFSLDGSPVDGYFQTGRWQRWESNISYEQLSSGALLDKTNPYIRIFVGYSGGTANANRTLYVDDIVCTPSMASISMKTYDLKGAVTSVTGSNHKPVFFDVDYRGIPAGSRDEEYKLYGQSAHHDVGEN